ncbi:MAG: pitrilysin family protein [Gemmatimonadota bacterium]
MSFASRFRHARAALLFGSLFWCLAAAAEAQSTRPVGREAAIGLRFGELRFEPPQVQKRTLESGVTLFLTEDHSLPLVTLYARFQGGYAVLPRSSYAAATALPGLLRNGGTTVLPPDSVDYLLDFYALQMTFGGGGQSTSSSVNTLTKHLRPAVELWTDILRNPRFDSREVEIWRDRQREGIRRRGDDPGLLAVSEFNRIMFGDHPVGWEMDEEDLGPERMNPEAVFQVYSRIFCRENMILGVVGDVRMADIAPVLEEMVSSWPSCTEPLLDPTPPQLRKGRRVFLIPKDLTQSTVVMAAPGGISQSTDPDYFASRIGNSILGANGFSSRLLSRVRTEMGYAYSASSLWTTPSRYEGIVGAMTQTKSGSTVAATQLILDIFAEMRNTPPAQEEVDQVIAQIVNGFVFNFQDPSQIVSRQMFYLSEGLPEDYLERFIRGIQRVDPEAVRSVFNRYVHPEEMIILIVGNPDDFDLPPDVLGEVQIWEIGG